MAQTPVANSVQLCQVFQQNADETPPLKRPKKKHGTPTGKNVVVLKRDDVLEKDGVVFMPNTIEMAQLKKTEKGQFKTNVQISSKMSEMDIKQILEESFPLLANRTFYCAGAADNRTRLDFHGERRIWDGRLIKQKIKGNSVLYIFTNEERLGKQYPTSSKLAAPKRSYDQMTQTMKNEGRIETVGHSVGINQNFISTQSKSQTREPLLRTADMRAEANQSHSGLQGMVSPPLLPQMGSLTISHTASEWEKAQCAQATVGKNIFMHAPWEVKEKQGEGNNSDSTVGESYHPPIQSSVVNAQVNWAMDTACINKAVKVVGTSESDYELQLSDLAVERFTDSGFEASDGLRINDGSSETGFEPVFRGLPVPSNLSKDPCADILNSQSGQDLPSDVNPPSSQLCNTEMLVQDREETSSCGAADDVPALLRDLFGTVQGICPSSGSVKGGFQFNITLDEALPEKVKGGEAHFEAVNVPVRKLNPFTLCGIVPSSQVPGTAAVTVITDSGQDLGFTFFEYIDDAEDWLKQLVEDPMLQSKYFALLSTKFAHGSSANTSNIAHGKGKGNLPGHGSSVQKMQQQSVKLLQLMVYTAAQTNAQEFIEMIFSTSAGQIVFNAYKDKTPLPEDVARENGHDELARYFQDVHARLSLDKNGHSTVIDWLELLEAVQKQSLTTQDESPVGLDQSDEDDDDSSDYFADAETSSCGSCDDDPGWPEISEKKESCVQDGISSEVQITSESNDLSMTCSSKASFTKNERIIKGESTKGQTTRNDICFVVKQGSSCLDKGRETGEYSELSSSLGCVADLLEMSCEDLNNENSISKGPCIHGEIANEVQSTGECNDLSRTSSSKALFTKNERIITGESTKGQITRDEISFVVKQGSSCLDKGEEREISELSKPQRITSLPELFVMSCEDPGEDNLNFSTSRNNMAKEPKEPCIQEVTSNEVRPVEIIVSWCDDRSMTSSKASFTKNEKIVEVESTKRQTTSEDRAFAMKQGSSCLEKGKEREFSELSRPEKISCLPKLLGTSCEDLNSGDIVRTESSTGDGIYVETYIKSAVVSDHSPMNKFAIKTSDSNNDRILTSEELNQEPTAKPDEIAMNSKAHMNKEEEVASTAEEGVILDTEGGVMSIKQGVPEDHELLSLAEDISVIWKKLGLALALKNSQLDEIEADHLKGVDRSYAMLRKWKESRGSEASYERLAEGLDDKAVSRRDLIEAYCRDLNCWDKEAELQRKTSELKVSCNYETDGVLKGPPSVEILPGKPFHATQRRGGEIQKIQQAFSQLRQDATASSLVSAVYVKGPPGCGKTQLVRQFGKEYMKVSAGCGGQSPRRIVATLDARTPESLLESYKELHEKLEMSKESEERGSLNERLKTYSNVIKNHLCKSSTVWLLIIDNLTVNDPLREFWPTPEENSPWGEGLVLVTTQDSELVPRSHAYAKVVGLDEGMEQSDAKKLLSTISELEADEDAIKVAQLLGFYPLSLACAAVYVKQMREDRPASEFSWKNYLADLKKCFAYLDHSDFTRHNPCYPQSMLPAAEFAARRMAENNEVLRAAFVFLSYCALQPVPLDTVAEYVFYETAASGDQTIRVPDDVKVKIAQCSLLIYPETGERGIEVVTLHQVMRLAFAQIRRKPDEQTKEMEETAEVEKRQLNGVLEVLNKAYKIRKGDVSKEAIATRIILCPHLREFVEKAENSQFVEVNLLVEALVYLVDGLVHVAGATDNNRVGLLERAYKINKQLSTTDISACELPCELGYTYREAGQLDRVILVLDEANHLCTAHTEREWMEMRSSLLNIVGFTYRESFKLDLAKEYMKMCAEVTRKAYGEKHVQVVERLCNLGIILHDRWENDEAIEVLEEAQKIIEACDTSRTELFIRAQVLNYTAKVHLRWYLGLRYTHPCAWSTKKHLEESNALYEEAVKIYEELHGDPHKFTVGTMMTYGTAKLHLGQVEQAYEMCHNAVQVYRSSGHISWPRAGTWLADVFLVRKEYARAKSFLEELVKVHEDLHLVVSPGAYHPKALLAEACVHLGNVQYGKDMLTQCLREWEEKGMHPDHYWVARARAFLRLHEEQNTDDAVQEL